MRELFNTSLGVKLNSRGVVHEVMRFMQADTRYAYKIIIGSDSLLLRNNDADFVTAIVVHRVGNGGRYFWRRTELKKFYTLRDRIISEVLLSLEVAQDVLRELKEAGAVNYSAGGPLRRSESEASGSTPSWDFEIHVDIGENGETKSMMQEVVGMIRAHNFEAKTKPDSYAASKVADRHV